MMNFIKYLFHPNPGRVTYASPSVISAMIVCAALIVLCFVVKYWRAYLSNAVTKKISRSWASTCFWFGVSGLVLTVSRVEKIQFIAMRFLWVLWGISLLLVILLQWRIWRIKYYAVLPRVEKADPRNQYLPAKKR